MGRRNRKFDGLDPRDGSLIVITDPHSSEVTLYQATRISSFSKARFCRDFLATSKLCSRMDMATWIDGDENTLTTHFIDRPESTVYAERNGKTYGNTAVDPDDLVEEEDNEPIRSTASATPVMTVGDAAVTSVATLDNEVQITKGLDMRGLTGNATSERAREPMEKHAPSISIGGLKFTSCPGLTSEAFAEVVEELEKEAVAQALENRDDILASEKRSLHPLRSGHGDVGKPWSPDPNQPLAKAPWQKKQRKPKARQSEDETKWANSTFKPTTDA